MVCLLCDAPERAGTIVFDDGRVRVLLHDDWAVAGHAMVVACQHVENASDLAPEDAGHFWEIYARAERAVLETAGAERAMMLKLGIQVPHLHVHIYPVATSADRAAVFAAFDGKSRDDAVDREAFAAEVRGKLQNSSSIGP
jgi:diadenosine tetraphosphate (Ap4A) HIT family hydrolase